ncbi:MAG: hypothetical protein WA790_03695 [Sulfitobacter sp.]
MTKKKPAELEYREVILPNVGRVMVPAHMSDAEIIAELDEAEKPKPSKTAKK